MEDCKVIIGFINKFDISEGPNKQSFNGHPKQGRIYRVIKDGNNEYRIHLGYENTTGAYNGIFLGNTLKGAYHNHWKFDISPVTKENISDFPLTPTDIRLAKKWFKDSHNDILPELVDVSTLPNAPEMGRKLITALVDADKYFDDRMKGMGAALNTIVGEDHYLAIVLAETLEHIGKTMGDKYENSGRINLNKEYILSAKTPEHCIASAMKYMMRYDTEGFEKSRNPKDLMKAIHYLLFELQRSFIQHQTNDQKNFPNI